MGELELAADRPRRRDPSFAGERVHFTLPAAAVEDLRELSRALRVTPFMMLAAAFSALLHRCSGEGLIALGTPASNRTRREVEGLVGLFVNTLVLTSDFRGDPTFAESVARVRASTLDALTFQELPLEKLVEALRPARNLARNPLFSVMFSHNHAPSAGLRLAGAEVQPLVLDLGTAKLDLVVETQDSGDAITGTAEYSAELFERTTIERLAARFTTLLGAAVRAPDTPVSRLPLLDEGEHRQVVVGPNRTASPYPRDESVASLFRAQAQRSPAAVAVVHGERSVSYGELDVSSDLLAAALRSHGVAGGDLVGVAVPRSLAEVTVTLAILKAGAAYLPLASEEPPARVSRILAETGARLVVAEDARAAELEGTGAAVVRWTDLAAAAPPHDPPPRSGAGERVAYVMYTSGSTGTPKGIAVPHRAIARLVIAPDYVVITPEDGVAHLSNPAFDAATFELWGALLNGARLIVVDREQVLDPAELARVLRERGVTIAFLTTALFNEVALAVPTAFAKLRYLLVGGETLAPDRIRRVLQAGKPRHLLNVYGPTESTTFATSFEIHDLPEDATTVPIGRPIARTTCFILDPHGEPAPIGVPGELHLGGDGLAVGYIGGPPELAARFVPDRFSATPGARLYRTGDRARWRADGTIELLGRLDRQIKLRGFRVEPGEIEAVLREHPGVAEAAVMLHQRERLGPRLVAFVVAAPGADLAPAGLRAFARKRLPDYMTPAELITLPRLPLTASGKVDRAALAAMEVAAPAGEPPRTPLEHAVAAILAELLGTEKVGLDDDFFALGGHSLLAVRATAAVTARFDVPFKLRHFFLAPTVGAIAATVLALRLARLSSAEQEQILHEATAQGPGEGE